MSFISGHTFSQNVSSPYSILGIGDIESNDYGRFSATGSASVARRNAGFYNFSNPASLTVMPYKSINLDFGFRGRFSNFKSPGADTSTATSKDFIIKRITLAFKVGKKTGIAFGLKPFSSVNYQYTAVSTIADGDAKYDKYVIGTGGLYDVYFSIGREIEKHLSIGATATWRFGSLQQGINYYNPDYLLDITRSETRFYYGAGLLAGLQYYSLPGKKWQHNIGITAAFNTSLKGQTTTDYTSAGTNIKTTVENSEPFKLPVTLVAAYALSNNKGILVTGQLSYNHWPTQTLSYANTITSDAFGVNAGVEYSHKIKKNRYSVEDYFIGLGGKAQESYVLINNQKLTDYSFTIGGGKSISRVVSLNGSLEIGNRGRISLDQIRENYTQLNIGLTVKDFWSGTKHFGRFN